MDLLRKRREMLGKGREVERQRKAYGPILVGQLAPAFAPPCSLDDFRVDIEAPVTIEWPSSAHDARGMYAPNLTRDQARQVAARIHDRIGNRGGLLGVFGSDYLGWACRSSIVIPGLVDAAEQANDSVAYYPEGIEGVIVFDCYKVADFPPFNVLIQGREIEERLAGCL
jgi:hypothetical protein